VAEIAYHLFVGPPGVGKKRAPIGKSVAEALGRGSMFVFISLGGLRDGRNKGHRKTYI
jgi:ATP-dependent Lon protease